MLYINPTITGTTQDFYINTRALVTDSLVWTIKREGNESIEGSFNTPGGSATFTDGNYYQTLSFALTGVAIDLDDDVMYLLEAKDGGEIVFKDLLFSTSQAIPDYSVNDGEYTEHTQNNDYIILE